MGGLYFNSYDKELEKCSLIYKGFRGSEPLIKLTYEVINAFFNDNPLIQLPVIDLEDSTDKIRASESINLNPVLETAAVIELLKKMSEVLVKVNPRLKETVSHLKEKLDCFLADSPTGVGKKDIFGLRDKLIKETVLEEDLATFLFSIMLSSFYRQHLQSSAEVLRTDLWEGGDCPLCAEKPHFGMLRPVDGAKQLECWLCGTKWLHTRIKCPFCENEEQEDLGYFTAEDNEICRVNFCKSCCRYYKIFDARKFDTDGNPALTIHNLATLAYDLMARQEGFYPGSGLEWVNEDEVSLRED